MAGDDRPPAHSLIERLSQAPFAFDFFQAVRRMECAHPDRPRIGSSRRLNEDPLRFGQEPSLAFAPSPIASFQAAADGGVPRLSVHFLGLLGPNGPMPLHFTEYVRGRLLVDHDPTLARFLDVFHHRMISLFYRAWASHQLPVSRDRPDEDRFAVYIGSLIGIGMDSFQRRDRVQDEAKLFYAGRLGCQTKNEEGIRAILSDYFSVPTRIAQFIGQWIELPPQYRLKLGDSPDTGAVGRTAVIGSRLWDCRQKFRIVFGPLSFKDFERFLPTGRSFRRLADWVRNYTSGALGADLQLLLKAEEVPSIQLGALGQLGWSTWLTSQAFDHDADDLVLLSIAA
jgi:type VI secretion system protein ImpH